MVDLRYINIIDDINIESKQEIESLTGAYLIDKNLENPTSSEIESLFKSKNIDRQSILEILGNNVISEVLYNNLTEHLNKTEKLQTPRENAYKKVVYWINKYFKGIVDKKDTYIICNYTPKKNEMLLYYILSTIGINVIIITKEIDILKLSNYNNIEITRYNTNNNLSLEIEKFKVIGVNGSNECVRNLKVGASNNTGSLYRYSDRKMPTNKRVNISLLSELEYSIESSKAFPSIIIKGYNTELSNILYKLNKNKLDDTLIIKDSLYKIGLNLDKENNSILDNYIGYLQELGDISGNKVKQFISWNNYTLKYKNILIYGDTNKTGKMFIEYLINIGKNVMYVTDNKDDTTSLDYLTTIDLGETSLKEYPTQEIKDKASTVAYRASEEINNTLYNGDNLGLYRINQFKDCKSIVLNTTFDEVSIYWEKEAMYRPSFNTEDNLITIPNFFIKISGTLDNEKKYINTIKKLNTENTILYNSNNDLLYRIITRDNSLNEYVQTGRLTKRLKNISIYGDINVRDLEKLYNANYNYLDDSLKFRMINKIVELVNSDYIIYKQQMQKDEYISLVVLTIMSLNKESIELLQSYDLTQEIPKILLVSTTNEKLNIINAIYLVYMSLLGVDIGIIVPTRYKSIESYINANIYQEHNIGKANFDIKATDFIPTRKKVNEFIGSLANFKL